MEKRGLGRGLAALIPDAADSSRATIRQIASSRIAPNPFQPRTNFDESALTDLENSIREHGLLQPIIVRETSQGIFQVVAGERRLRAARNAGLDSVPTVVRECTDSEMLEMALVENLQREDINPMEAARAYHRMQTEFKMTQDQIARRVGKSRTSIANAMRLLQLPDSIQASLERGEITEGHGRAIMMAEAPALMKSLFHQIVNQDLSVRETEKRAKASREGRGLDPESSLGAASHSDPNLSAIVDALRETFQTHVSIRYNPGGGGRIEISFYSEEELQSILEKILGWH